MNSIYKLSWYLENEGQTKENWMSNEIYARLYFRDLYESLSPGCWICLEEYVEKDEKWGFEFSKQIDFVEINS